MAPEIAQYWERAEFPHHMVPKLAKLNLGASWTLHYLAQGRISALWSEHWHPDPGASTLPSKISTLSAADVTFLAGTSLSSGHWQVVEGVVNRLAHAGGGVLKGYGCPGQSIMAAAMANVELARVDGSMSTFLMVHNSLCMLTIGTRCMAASIQADGPSVQHHVQICTRPSSRLHAEAPQT